MLEHSPPYYHRRDGSESSSIAGLNETCTDAQCFANRENQKY